MAHEGDLHALGRLLFGHAFSGEVIVCVEFLLSSGGFAGGMNFDKSEK